MNDSSSPILLGDFHIFIVGIDGTSSTEDISGVPTSFFYPDNTSTGFGFNDLLENNLMTVTYERVDGLLKLSFQEYGDLRIFHSAEDFYNSQDSVFRDILGAYYYLPIDGTDISYCCELTNVTLRDRDYTAEYMTNDVDSTTIGMEIEFDLFFEFIRAVDDKSRLAELYSIPSAGDIHTVRDICKLYHNQYIVDGSDGS